jgi:peroxiredoxin
MRICITALLLLGPLPWGQAGQFNPTRSIGDSITGWTDLPGTDGKKHSLKNLSQHKVVVVVFTCNTCPVANDYEDRVAKLVAANAHRADKVAVVAINANKVAGDQLPDMVKRAEKQKYAYPYLHDESQTVAKQFGAVYTPEFFVLDEHRKLIYMGSMDDNGDPAKAKVNFVAEAIEAGLNGKKPATTETLARGCMVRYAKPKRKP